LANNEAFFFRQATFSSQPAQARLTGEASSHALETPGPVAWIWCKTSLLADELQADKRANMLPAGEVARFFILD
jgi:hypothetical protein